MASLGRPGGNLTGLASQSDELWEKRLGLLKEVVPRLSRVAVIANPSNPGNVSCMEEIRSVAQGLRLQLSYLEASEQPRSSACSAWSRGIPRMPLRSAGTA